MTQRPELKLKAPTIFSTLPPAEVLTEEETLRAFGGYSNSKDTFSSLLLSYGKYMLAEAETYLEANEGAKEIVHQLVLAYSALLPSLEAFRVKKDIYLIKAGITNLYLVETDEGDVYLYFFSIWDEQNLTDDCRLDLSGLGSENAALFIATIISSSDPILKYMVTPRMAA